MRILLNYLEKHFKEWKDIVIGIDADDYTLKEMRLIYFSDALLDIITYDEGLSEEISKYILEVIQVIYDNQTFEYCAKDKEHYLRFILVANVLSDCKMIEWGTSIRGCWLKDNDFIKFPGIDDVEFKINDSKDYLHLIKWLNGEDVKIEDEKEEK